MIETLRDRYEDAQNDAQNGEYRHPLRDTPDGTNDGISPMENILAFAVATGTAFLARKVLKGGWRATVGTEPPKNPASRHVDWSDAILWGAVSGAIVGATRIASRRAASTAYSQFRS